MEKRNLAIAIVLSIAIMVGWMYFVQAPHQEKQLAAQQQQQAQVAQQPAAQQPGTQQPEQAAPQDAARKTLPRDEALKESPRVAIDTPRLAGSIALKGSRVDDLVLKNYRETVEPNSPQVVLLSPFNSEHAYYADFGWAGNNVALPNSETVWAADSQTLAPGKPVTLTWDNGQGLTFARKFEIDDGFMFTVTETVTNGSGSAVEISPYGRIVRYGTPPHASQSYVLHEGPVGAFDCVAEGEGKPNDCSRAEYSYSDMRSEAEDGGKYIHTSLGGWLGISDKYWLVAQIPAQDENLSSNMFYEPKGDFYQTDFTGQPRQLPTGQSIERKQHLFAGAKVVNELTAYRDSLKVPQFDRAVDFGMFWFLTKPLFFILDHIFRFVGNFGIAILCLTVLVKAAMFPLANKSYHSMSKMKLLTPKMTELREKYGNDKAKLNQEMMALYKREKVNPAAGCLPILVQIPVFYALYKVLYVTIEMRHAPFFGWIKDLSAPDPTSILNLFGLIPWDYHALFAVPLLGGLVHFLSIGIWPLIMGFTMWAQMKLNPTPPDPVQARIFGLMPFIFTFMLAPFSAGLVIYWAWNNTLSVAQQKLIMWRMSRLEKKPSGAAG
ncbi:MAG TPA: membrane protein insertase YidC [Dongiaceae bacterium]|nr:membrane protein insertase YidC [Dongiaceae bacterium]